MNRPARLMLYASAVLTIVGLIWVSYLSLTPLPEPPVPTPPLPTATTTPVPLPTATATRVPTLTPTPDRPRNAIEAQRYAVAVLEILQAWPLALGDLTALLVDPQIENQEWAAAAIKQAQLVNGAYDRLQAIPASGELQEVQANLLSVLQPCQMVSQQVSSMIEAGTTASLDETRLNLQACITQYPQATEILQGYLTQIHQP